MKTIIALLIMTSVAVGQQIYTRPGSPIYSGGITSSAETGTISVYPPDPRYTLVLRDKRGVTMLIRQIDSCSGVASYLKASPDIESAECFK